MMLFLARGRQVFSVCVQERRWGSLFHFNREMRATASSHATIIN